MRDQLEAKLARFEELERELIDPAVMAQPQRMAAVAREHGSLARLARRYRGFVHLERQIADLDAFSRGNDHELKGLAEAELPELRARRDQEGDEHLDVCSDDGDADRGRCVMELRAGTGGDEAALFVRDLYEMYRRYATEQGWQVEVLDASPTELGGFKDLILGLSGAAIFRCLQWESGGHRVQRVPDTETKGRIHTSAATVAVLPEPEDVEVTIAPDEYRKDLFCASGPGGQHVNKTASAVRLTHLETGLVVQCQDEKSQHKNKAKAMQILRARLYDRERERLDAERSAERRGQIGSGDRSERIRTYNFPQGRVTDHRINLTLYKLDAVIEGPALEELVQALVQEHQAELLARVEADAS